MFDQIFQSVNLGLVILDPEMRVTHWNRWLENTSGLRHEDVQGRELFEVFPDVNRAAFVRKAKSVLQFGNYVFFSQKLHKYLLPIENRGSRREEFPLMQQSVSMGPVRDESNHVVALFLVIQDVTDIASYEKKLVLLSTTDSLTGLFNRRTLENALERELTRVGRYGSPLSFIVFDLDFFKDVNDTYGHHCGDEVLKKVGSIMQRMLRQTDTIARYGGEEFCCLLPETTQEDALCLAERIREEVQRTEFRHDGRIIRITVSGGVSTFGGQVDTSDKLFSESDRALYEAKGQGRNRIMAL